MGSLFLTDEECFSIDDVLLVPQYSEVESRLDTDLSTRLTTKVRLKCPIVSASMDTVTGVDMAVGMSSFGGAGFLHRFASDEKTISMIKDVKESGALVVVSVGIRNDILKWVGMLLEYGADVISIDIAHGHSLSVLKSIEMIKSVYSEAQVVGGNVATAQGAQDLINAGVDAVKGNIGPGSLCTTRISTGHGVPSFSAIAACVGVAKKHNVPVIADGGIRYGGDIVKYLAIGAESCMIGSLFARTEEAEGERMVIGGNLYKSYRGMASNEAQAAFKGGLKKGTCAEGVSIIVPIEDTLERVMGVLIGGIRSGLTYSGAHSIKELQQKAKFVRVSTATLNENRPFGLDFGKTI